MQNDALKNSPCIPGTCKKRFVLHTGAVFVFWVFFNLPVLTLAYQLYSILCRITMKSFKWQNQSVTCNLDSKGAWIIYCFDQRKGSSCQSFFLMGLSLFRIYFVRNWLFPYTTRPVYPLRNLFGKKWSKYSLITKYDSQSQFAQPKNYTQLTGMNWVWIIYI